MAVYEGSVSDIGSDQGSLTQHFRDSDSDRGRHIGEWHGALTRAAAILSRRRAGIWTALTKVDELRKLSKLTPARPAPRSIGRGVDWRWVLMASWRSCSG